ncbi:MULTISPECIES: type II secretion system F family protein [Stenotrophomonas maltophilia group]|jgi:tight adherence protein B|uniref:Pilus assembly protein n=1 Tax=Stenotrophomonas maltophilia TaxID=40324 RepID=A0A246HXI4_STEMA|nr:MULTISPECIES: type II secretion system F family protein [Stenotrophomonas maltophilia group]MCZ7842742.1 type II secretion system F family protein [Stenotrophomonas maltophilia]MDJ1625087.1 type II secretion system F family protein [Stenotrophomonas sepilia]OWQ69637.1 pilus assembly protein [Stenotrophomonas maltophilia]PZT35496.1 pilus assembly protein [Stenotrophomonas sepilia]UXB34697.1 type II secretion system F family protein [Stenotrophomonas maltophilia]
MGTGLLLGVLSIISVLLALAVWLWGTAASREQRQASLQHAEQQLARGSAAGAVPAGPAVAAANDSTRPASAGTRVLPWDGVLQRAGLQPGWKLPLMLLVPGLVLAVVAAMRLGTAWMFPLTLLLYLLGCWLWVMRRITKLRAQLLHQMPDFLDNLVRLTALGNSLQAAFQVSSMQTSAPLRGLLDTTVRYARSGMDLDRALSLAAQPYRMDVLKVLAVVIGVSVRIGGRADQILQRMGDFMRDLEQAQQELAATTSETRMSAWVLGLLPPASAVLMAISSPAFFQPVLHDPLGHRILLIALGLELLGAFLLYRLAKSL